MKTKITELKNGKIKIEAFGLREWCKTSHHDDGFWDEKNPEPLCIRDWKGNERNAIAGDCGCLVISRNVSGDEDISAFLFASEVGMPGNMNPAICRLHGWRGTTGNRESHAYGWRRVESITPRKRGIGCIVLFSEDLKLKEA